MGRMSVFLAALWWGGISAISFIAVPVLFGQLGNPALAGTVAAKLFSIQSIGVFGIALALLASQRVRGGRRLLLMLALAVGAALAQEFVIAPHILQARAMGESVRTWHSLGTLLILVQWLLGGAVLFDLLQLQHHAKPSARDGG